MTGPVCLGGKAGSSGVLDSGAGGEEINSSPRKHAVCAFLLLISTHATAVSTNAPHHHKHCEQSVPSRPQKAAAADPRQRTYNIGPHRTSPVERVRKKHGEPQVRSRFLARPWQAAAAAAAPSLLLLLHRLQHRVHEAHIFPFLRRRRGMVLGLFRGPSRRMIFFRGGV